MKHLLFFLLIFKIAYSQIAIGNFEPNPNSVLDLSNKKGRVLILPKLSQSQIDSLKAKNINIEGSIYYNTNSKAIQTYSNNKAEDFITLKKNESVTLNNTVKNETKIVESTQNNVYNLNQINYSLLVGYTGLGWNLKLSLDRNKKSPHGYRFDLYALEHSTEAEINQKFHQYAAGFAYQLIPNLDLGGWKLKSYAGVYLGGKQYKNVNYSEFSDKLKVIGGTYFGVDLLYAIDDQVSLFGGYTNYFNIINKEYTSNIPSFGLGISFNKLF